MWEGVPFGAQVVNEEPMKRLNDMSIVNILLLATIINQLYCMYSWPRNSVRNLRNEKEEIPVASTPTVLQKLLA
jgi:hypothetical protein